jgi:hypothetical protein
LAIKNDINGTINITGNLVADTTTVYTSIVSNAGSGNITVTGTITATGLCVGILSLSSGYVAVTGPLINGASGTQAVVSEQLGIATIICHISNKLEICTSGSNCIQTIMVTDTCILLEQVLVIHQILMYVTIQFLVPTMN